LLCPYKGTGVVRIIGICQTEIIIVIAMLPFGLESFDLEALDRLRAERQYIPIIRTRARDLVSRPALVRRSFCNI
jgi:hypothetical protein